MTEKTNDMDCCPFCDDERVYLKKEVGGVKSVRCPGCGLMAVFYSPEAGAALKSGRMDEFIKKRWNTRAQRKAPEPANPEAR